MAKFKVIFTIILAVVFSLSVMAICINSINKNELRNIEAAAEKAKVFQSKVGALVFGQK